MVSAKINMVCISGLLLAWRSSFWKTELNKVISWYKPLWILDNTKVSWWRVRTSPHRGGTWCWKGKLLIYGVPEFAGFICLFLCWYPYCLKNQCGELVSKPQYCDKNGSRIWCYLALLRILKLLPYVELRRVKLKVAIENQSFMS